MIGKGVQTASTVTPTWVKRRLLGSKAGSICANVYFRTVDLEPVRTTTLNGEFTLYLPPGSAFAKLLEETGSYESGLIDDLASHVTSDSTFWDVGARYGYVTKTVQASGVPAENCHAFEVATFNCEIIERNVPDVHLNRGFVGDGTGNSLALDDYATEAVQPDIVKIDVEGAEGDVLRGMRETINECAPLIYLELHPQIIGKAAAESIISGLADCGYTLDQMAHHERESEWRSIGPFPGDEEFLVRATA